MNFRRLATKMSLVWLVVGYHNWSCSFIVDRTSLNKIAISYTFPTVRSPVVDRVSSYLWRSWGPHNNSNYANHYYIKKTMKDLNKQASFVEDMYKNNL